MEVSAAAGMISVPGAALALSSESALQHGDAGDLCANSLPVSPSRIRPAIFPPWAGEPIAGIANGDFWQLHCEPGDDRAECPAGDRED